MQIELTFLGVPHEDPFAFSGDDIPYPYCAIVASRD